MIGSNYCSAQLNLPLQFTENESKWANLVWIDGNKKEDQWFEMRVPPIIIEDTIYTFMNYRGLFQTGPLAGSSAGYCGYSIKKINKISGITYWETKRIYKDFLIRKALSQPNIADNKLNISLYVEAPKQFSPGPYAPGTEWNFCYPGSIVLNLNSGEIIDSSYVNNPDSSEFLLSIAGIASQNGDISPRIYINNKTYEHRINKVGEEFFEITKIDLNGKLFSRDSVYFLSKYLVEQTRYYELPDYKIAVIQISQSENWKNKELLLGHFDENLNLVSKIDLANHFTDTIGFCYSYRYDNGHFIIASGLENAEDKTLRLVFHMFDLKGNLIDSIRYTLRDGIDNGIVYGHFYPLIDIINNRILLSRCRQDTITEATYFDLFARDGDSIKLIKRILVKGINDHFRTEYATMMSNGDILMQIRQFIWSSTGFGGDYPRFYSWIMLDGQKMNIISQTNDKSYNENHLKLYPNPSNGIFKINVNNDEPKNMLVKIREINGKIVHYEKMLNEHLDLSHLGEGLYIAEIVITGKSHFRKIVLLK